jgi:long-chain acyl-CoA synthetase
MSSPIAVSRPWLANYANGVPATVDTSGYASLVDLLDESWHRHARRDAATCMGARLRFEQLDEMAASFGAWLQSRGLVKGEIGRASCRERVS